MDSTDSKIFEVNLNTYNGPLDVLLDLAKSQKVDLEKISVTKLADQFHKNNIATVIKHIPGHGLGKVDSHYKLPIINNSNQYLLKNDFLTFKNKNSLFAMTGHLLFKKIDNLNSVTHSKKIIKLIRNKINFKNLIMSDDISMKALPYGIKNNVIKAFTAGCDLVLHCNANLKEMHIVAENSPKLSKFIIKITNKYYKLVSNGESRFN